MISFFKQSIEKTEINTLENANKNALQGSVSRGKIPERHTILSKVANLDLPEFEQGAHVQISK